MAVDSSSPARRRRPGPARTLDVERVVTTALRLIDAGGPGALSVRAVAARLGVNPNAIYTYVPDRRALEQAIVERILSEVRSDQLTQVDVSWRRRILEYGQTLRAALLRHPGAVSLFMTAPMNGSHALDVGERLLAAFANAGLGSADAARATYLAIVYVLGFVALEVAETDGRPPLPAEAERIAQRRAGLAWLDPADHPRTAAAADVTAGWISTEQFEWGLNRLLDGLVRREEVE